MLKTLDNTEQKHMNHTQENPKNLTIKIKYIVIFFKTLRHLKKEKNLDELSKSLQWHQQFFLILKKRYIYYRDVNFWKFKILRLSHLLQLTVPPISTHLIPETHQSIQSSNHYRLYIVCGCGSRHYCGIRGTSNIEVNLCFLRVLLR